MLTIGKNRQCLCDGMRRRDFLSVGAIGALGLGLPTLLHAAASPKSNRASFGRAKRCVLLFLTGGPPQHDTWDLKPGASQEIRGELKPISTNVPGIQISELFPNLARRADKYCIIRSVTHSDTVHTSAGYTMLTGMSHPNANAPAGASSVQPSPDDHPHIGSLLSKARSSRSSVPTFVSLPEVIRDAGVNEFPGQDAGFLGKQFAPFRIETESDKKCFRLPEIDLQMDVSLARLNNRRFLREKVERRLASVPATVLTEMGDCYQRAFALIQSSQVRQAFDLDREPIRLREVYGQNLFGQGCLLARRLLEAGVSLVTVYWHYEGPDDSPVWDTHWNNYPHLRNRLMPPTDSAFSALLDDLSERGMLDDTLVLCMGEFGRTPRINDKGGRDHWPHVQSIVIAGAGVPGGTVYGASDATGAHAVDQAVTPPDIAATILHLLGVPHDLEIRNRTGQPLPATRGNPIYSLTG